MLYIYIYWRPDIFASYIYIHPTIINYTLSKMGTIPELIFGRLRRVYPQAARLFFHRTIEKQWSSYPKKIT